jgi:starch-binding outer membrane protein, SusD/RagB family
MNIITHSRSRGPRRFALPLATIAALTLAVAACDLDIADTNAPTVESLTDEPSRDVLARAAIGIFAQTYVNVGVEVQFYALYGREGYNLLGNDPRETNEQIRGPQDPAGRNSGIWLGPYAAVRTINTYLTALESASGLNEAELRASRGMAKTFKAWHLHRLAIRTGELGIPIEVDRPISDEPAPFVSFDAAMAVVSGLLDEARGDLEAAGSAAFPFPVGPGFSDFSTPAQFIAFNRALAAKVLVHRATFVGCSTCWSEAASALNASFVTDAGLPQTLDLGVYYAHSAAAGEPANPVTEPLSSDRFWVHASIVAGAQVDGGGSPDLRLTRKVADAGRSVTLDDLTGTYKPILYNNPSDLTADLGADIPWIHNEELLLLRAEIRWNTGNRAGAIGDLDLVRQHAGGLPPSGLSDGSTDEQFVTELLYNRLYSLLWAQGTRWIDARRYDRLGTLPIDRAGDLVFQNMLVPADECVARGLTAPCTPLS